jgi:cell wall-associated NlpC family hydrolase
MQAEDGRTIPKSHLQTGDLVFFDTNGVNTGAISHVGIYVGENKFLHADSTHGVMISNLNSDYYTRNYVKSVRVLS